MRNTDRKKVIQKYYSARAKDYDQQKSRTWKSEQGFGIEIFHELLNAFRQFENKIVLEVGVGSGRNAKLLLEEVKPHLIGLDLTKEMLYAAKNKLTTFKRHFDLILGDAEHLPFAAEAFDAILCMSTMHYFADQGKVLQRLERILKQKGALVLGDLSPHESDQQGFFERLERTVSIAHSRYYKASEMRRLLQNRAFHVSKVKTVPYRKLYRSLAEDKGSYFGIDAEELHTYIRNANRKAKEQYGLTDTELTQFYTIITAIKETKPK